MSSIVGELTRLSGPVVYLVVAALVFGETAVFLGFVIPGETAAVLGGVLAARGRVSLPWLIVVVLAAAVIGPLVGYEIGRRLGPRLVGARAMRRVAGPAGRAQALLRDRGGVAVLLGRFTAVLRALMPAAAGTAAMPYRTFFVFNLVGGIVWSIGYCLLGFAAGNAYAAIESRVGTGLAVGIAAVVVVTVAVWGIRRHRRPAERNQ